MSANDNQKRYMNCLAELLNIVNKFPLCINQLSSVQGYKAVAAGIKETLDHLWSQGFDSFFLGLDELIASLKSSPNGEHYVGAAAAALWMDQRISYQEQAGEQSISLYSMVPLSGDQPVFVDKLNTNDKVTGIQLHPRFEVCKVYNQHTKEFESFANRDIYYGLNGQMNHVSYVSYDEHQIIHNVVVPYEYEREREDGGFRIAFCPMSDEPSLLNLEEQPRKYKGIEMSGRRVTSIRSKEQLLARFENDLMLACRERADIVFSPEMLGMEALEKESAGFNTMVLDCALKVMEESKGSEENLRLPMLIFLPTWWRDGINSTTVVYQDGQILGVQEKYIPYVNTKEHWVEALREVEDKHILVIHIPGIHRIVTVICAEFQPMRDHMAKVLCGGLGATLILVPSYSKGEQDFINSLSTFKDYGVTVIWGNCCGAAKTPRVTGGCSIAGIDEIQRFGTYCACGQSCQGKYACLYLVAIPLELSREKPHGSVWTDPVKHCLLAECSTQNTGQEA